MKRPTIETLRTNADEKLTKMSKIRKSNWIDAYSDNCLNIHTLPQTLILKDVNLDNDQEVLVVDYGDRLKSASLNADVKIKIIKGHCFCCKV